MTRLTKLEARSVSLSRGGRCLFQGLSFEVNAGEAVALVGENGAGKTSLLRALAGLLRPQAGAIIFHGGDACLDSDGAIQAQAHLIGHHEGFAGSRTGREELMFTIKWTGGDAAVALKAADRLSMTPFLDVPVRRLSAGQRRRLALTRLVAAPRPLWLLDEAATSLDLASRTWFAEILDHHLRARGLIVAAAHDPLPIPAGVVTIAR